jgi:hypothetical protein
MSQSTAFQPIPGCPNGWEVSFKSRGQQRGVDRVFRAPNGTEYKTIKRAVGDFPTAFDSFDKQALNVMQDMCAKKLVAAESRFMSTDAEYEKQLMKQRASARARGVAPTVHTSTITPIRCSMKDLPGAPLAFRDPSTMLKYKPRLIVAPRWLVKIIQYTHTIENLFDKHVSTNVNIAISIILALYVTNQHNNSCLRHSLRITTTTSSTVRLRKTSSLTLESIRHSPLRVISS